MFLLLLKNWLYPWDYFQTGDHINLLLFKVKKEKKYSTNLNLDPIGKALLYHRRDDTIIWVPIE